MSLFEQASRLKIRFASEQGLLCADDLWDVPLTARRGANLDDIARGLFKELQETANISFVETAQKANTTTQLKFDLVKHIIDVRLAEAEVARSAAANKEKKQRILAIIEHKENEALGQTSIEDLKKMIEGI